MFPWNIARSAEALLSRWAIKRVCKFLLKKKLGNFIVGDIDLDQLDVQLGAGTIQLSDLALNVDYINAKLDATSVFVKEGSIGSLVVKVPWKVQNCQIEIKELEFVLTSRSNSSSSEDCSISTANEANKEECVTEETNNSDHERAHGDKKSIPLDVHQGVKTIAKMVKWLLTNFNIKIQNLIVAFDSSIEKVGKISEQSRVLVLRMNEIEYGTHVSESDTTSESSSNEDSFLGMTSLTNFVKFSGAAVDILQLEPSSSASSVPILTGKAGGFSGNVKLSIPWKNGSLDMQRLEADVSIDPVVLKLQPSTITSLLYLWKFLRRFNVNKKCNMPHVSKVSALSDSSSLYHSFTRGSSVTLSGGRQLLSSFTSQEAPIDALLPGAHYIPNWVPLSGSPEHEGDEEPDYAASVDQFFECLDGMWSSQSASYHSGLLNWTCSVFNTISAASNLASGSVCIPEIPQPCEMNLKASVGGIAIVLLVHDERKGVHYLMANCKDLVLAFQICSEKTNFQATLRHFRIDEYYEDKDRTDCQAPDCDGNYQDKAPPVQFLQTEVLSVMPQWDFSPCPDAEGMISGLPEVDVIRVPLLEFSDDSSCLVNMSSSSMVGVRKSSVSFTVKLAPFILWVISSPINVLVELMKKVCNSLEVGNTSGILSAEALHQSWNLQYKENVIIGGTSKHVTAKSPIKNVQGSVSLSSARLIVCFPFQCRDSSLRSFIGLDFSPGLNDGAGLDLYPKSAISSLKGLSEPSIKVHLRFGDLNAYLVTSSCRNSNNHAFSAKRFLFVSRNKKGQCSSVGISWQEDPVSGPWVAKKAKCRATSNDSKRTRTKVIGKDSEFATARIATGTEEGNGCLLQEMNMSSALSFHACFPLIQIELDSCEYRHLLYLLTEGVNDFLCGAGDLGLVGNEGNIEDLVDSYHGGEPSQTTIILECDVLSICATLECAEVGSCLQRELPGYWASLRLNVEKFELLSASNVGGSNGAKFLSISHGEGELWGSLDESVGANNFLLVSCSNSAMKRGDGEGTNALSSYSGGSTIVNFCESLSLKNYTSVSIRCATIIAPGGRLDWMNAVCSFFSLSNERESPVKCSLQEDCAEDSFSLSLVDSALSYEPKMSVRNPEVFGSEHTHEEFVACIIATSVLDVSKHAMGSSIVNDYKLGLLDVGLLVSTLSGSTVRCDYGVDALRKNGFVKVAGEAIMDLVIRVNSSEEPLWELECSDFHVKLNTCQDTTAAIVHLASQLQQLFAPDIEESLAHLQTRWDMVQQAHGASEDTANLSNLYMNPFPSGSSHDHTFKKDVVGLMDEIVQDAFQLSRDQNPHDSSRVPTCVKEELVLAASESNMRSNRLTDAYPIVPKFTERYCISRLLPPDSFPKDGYFSNENSYCKFKRSVQGKTGSAKNSGWYEDCTWNIVENHVSNADNFDEIHEDYKIVSPISVSRAESYMPRGRVILKNFNIWWKMYNGLDWNLTTSSRDSTYSMEWVLSSMNVQYDIFAEGEMYVSKLILSVREFYLYDWSRDAPWKMVLGYYHTKDRPRESYAEALKVELETVRPEPQIPLEEYRLCLSLLPLRLNLDQSQLDFLVKFFAFQSPSSDPLLDASNDSSKSIGLPTGNTRCGEPNVVAEALLPFFQKCDINPVVVRVDYNPRHIDLAALRGGNYTELLNLVPWKGIELLLKDVHAVDLYGWGNVCETVLGEWLEDISHNQIHKLLKGLAPIRSLVAVSTGAAKLVSLPVKSYRKDQRLLKGMQRGAVAFVRSISLEAVGLGVHLAAGAHDILLQTECILTSGSSSVPININKRSVRSNQPRNARQGMLQAYDSISDGLGKTASALVGNPLKTYQRGGSAGSALASAIRAAPAAVIVPASAAARAMHCALLGVRNSLSPERKKESVEKYSGPSQSFSVSETGDSGGKNVQRLPLV